MSRSNFVGNVRKGFFSALLLGFSCPIAALGQIQDACGDAVTISLGASFRSYGGVAGESHFFRLELPAAGLVTLEAAVPGASESEAKLGLVDCGSAAERNFKVVERSADRLELVVWAPGTLVVRVAAQDPRSPLEQFRLAAAFVSTDSRSLCSPLPPQRAAPPWRSLADGADKEEDEGVIEIEPDNKAAQTPKWPSIHQQLCRQGEVDDHGDARACATRLQPGQDALAGEIGNGWGDDQDTFAFRLSETQTVRLETSGETDTFGVLFDGHGHRLARDDDGGDGAGFRIVKTLSPGLYFLRVEGRHSAEGPYALAIETSAW